MFKVVNDPVCFYYKDLSTGVEMKFTRNEWGWCVSFPTLPPMEALSYKGKIPWPKLSEQDQLELQRGKDCLRLKGDTDESGGSVVS